jgi:putative transposase
LWRAVDQESMPRERSECFGCGDVVDVFLQSRRNAKAAKVFFKRLLTSNKGEPREIVTDELSSYNVARRELIAGVGHNSKLYANNKAELSHQVTRVRERGMRKFKSVSQANRSLSAHKEVYNLFNLGRNLISARHYRDLREGAFGSCNRVVAV